MKSSNAPAARSGIPEFAGDQQAEILRMLREAGQAGVSKADLIFAKRMSQSGARVFELEDMGYKIAHVKRDGEKYVRFILEFEPLDLKPATSQDWYEKQHGPRPKAQGEDTAGLPLFDAVQR